MNLPVEIIFNHDTITKIKYLYTAAGIKRAKFVITPPTRTGLPPVSVQTDYLDGYQYAKGGLQYFPTAEGYVDQVKLFETNVNVYSYVFQYKDHLGNARLNYAWDPKNEQVKIKEENHYYPFGLKHSNYNSDYLEFQEELQGDMSIVTLSFPNLTPFYKAPYNYKYQEQERQEELGLNWDSFKWRNYDYAIGRFMSVDPLAEDYEYNSPYAFQENKMGMGRELEGLELTAQGTHLQNELNKTVASAKQSLASAWDAVGNFFGEMKDGISDISTNGVQFWVDNSDLKMDGAVKPDKAKDRSKTGSADVSALDAVTKTIGTKKEGVGKTLRERTNAHISIEEKADEIDKKNGGKNDSDKVTVKYEEYSATGTVGINTSKVHKKEKDSTIVKSNV